MSHPRLVLKNEATSSNANSRPPMGALKATATPIAAPARGKHTHIVICKPDLQLALSV
jgi:hypothetical protein